ncbi:hypothetical protein [Plastoroseomonas arctica]|uniref:Uncharacterized protein n=1 Tax=Plastoroseomonas arctica TaxID=1509237 RepID=A0AAF1K4W4_9PROT|nr:hypothetical protein [Plastoroseomonas arctica]MBR0656184.1 hypothetical protein [Plastoroseomonas arctica]
MIDILITAGKRLAEALHAENEALAKLDLGIAGELAGAKMRASDAFAAAAESCRRLGLGDGPRDAALAEALAGHLADLGAENRRLLARAIQLQSRVIETIAGAALPHAETLPGYSGLAPRPIARKPPALVVTERV